MWLLSLHGWAATFSRLYVWARERHHQPMLNLDHVIDLIIELGRAIIVDVLSERVQKLSELIKLHREPHGMAAIRRHIHRRAQHRLFNRISTRL